ncbi:MAG: hypothetical protein SFY69_08445 [Planctomycetota bacterium]|nr:hypothetical protein [Planctomycetota bacterium]
MGTERLDPHAFRAAETVFRAPFADLALHVESSNQGPFCDHWPRCAAVLPGRAVALVHQHTSDQRWRLTIFDPLGRIASQRPLAGIPGIGLNTEVFPRAVGFTPAGDILLLFSRGFDKARAVASDFAIAVLSALGQPLEHWNLPPDFQFFGVAFPMGERVLASLWQRPVPAAWRSYAPTRDARFGTGVSGALAPVAGAASSPVIVDLVSRTEARVLRPGAEARTVRWRAGPLAGQSVHGLGRFFGMVDFPEREIESLGEGRPRTLALFYLDIERAVVIRVVETQILPLRDDDADTRFEVCLPGQGVIDADGDYHELVWTPDALLLRRYPSDRERLAARLDVREEERGGRDVF